MLEFKNFAVPRVCFEVSTTNTTMTHKKNMSFSKKPSQLVFIEPVAVSKVHPTPATLANFNSLLYKGIAKYKQFKLKEAE